MHTGAHVPPPSFHFLLVWVVQKEKANASEDVWAEAPLGNVVGTAIMEIRAEPSQKIKNRVMQPIHLLGATAHP